MNSPIAVLNGDQIYLDELVRENARLTVQVEAERQLRQTLSADLPRMRDERDKLAHQMEEAEENLSRTQDGQETRLALTSKLDQAIKDLHFVMADGDACTVCKNKCLMGTTDVCKPRWRGLDE